MTAPATLTPAELEAMRDELVRARARGTRVVMVEGRRVEYATDPEMAAALADIETRLRRARHGPVRTILFTSSKGV